MLKSSVENTTNSRYDEKLKHLIQAKIDQDTGILLANILPISLYSLIPKRMKEMRVREMRVMTF